MGSWDLEKDTREREPLVSYSILSEFVFINYCRARQNWILANICRWRYILVIIESCKASISYRRRGSNHNGPAYLFATAQHSFCMAPVQLWSDFAMYIHVRTFTRLRLLEYVQYTITTIDCGTYLSSYKLHSGFWTGLSFFCSLFLSNFLL